MTFLGALLDEHGVRFGIAAVRPWVLQDHAGRDRVARTISRALGGVPTVLISISPGRPSRLYGRQDLVRFMKKVPLSAVPWRKFRLEER